MQYSPMFKDKMIRRMTGPGAISATALSREVDVPQSSLSRWLRKAGVGSRYGFPNNPNESYLMTDSKKSKRPQDWSPEDKLKIIIDAASLDNDQLGGFLREKGLHETTLEQWRLQMLEALQNGRPTPKKSNPSDSKRIKALEKDLARKEKALAETAALLVLKKKVLQIWGDEDDDTTRKKDK